MSNDIIYQIRTTECSYGEIYTYIREGLAFKTRDDAEVWIKHKRDKYREVNNDIVEIKLISYK